jgi:O-antigen ligase
VQFWGRFAGTLGHPNKLGYFLVLTTLLSLGQLLIIKPTHATLLSRLGWLALIAVQVLGIFLSDSLTAFIGLMLGILVLMVSSKVTAQRTLSILIPAFGVGILSISLGLLSGTFSLPENSPLGSSLISRAIDRVQMTTGPGRLVIFEQALQEIIKDPLVGAGYDQISTSGIDFVFRNLQGTIHNSLLQIFYTGGLFAFVGWLAIYVLVGWMALGVIRISQHNVLFPLILSLSAATIAILVMDQFQDAIYQREKWLVIGILVCNVWDRK